jgi:hypothetical protein
MDETEAAKRSESGAENITDTIKRTNRRRLEYIISVIVAISAIVTAIISFNLFRKTPDNASENSDYIINKMISPIRVDLDKLHKDMEDLKQTVHSMTSLSNEEKSAINIMDTDRKVSELTKKIDIIERAVVDNPERAMSLPMLRRDIDGLRTDLLGDIGTAREEISRIYDLSMWFLGLMGTMALGVLGMAVANLTRAKS